MLPEDIRHVFRSYPIKAVVHLAALKAAGESMLLPEKYSNANLIGTINLLNEMLQADVNKIVFSSSAAVYGNPQYLPMDEEHPLDPSNFYGFTKLQIEEILLWYSKLKNFKFVALRYFNAAGYDPTGQIRGLEIQPNNLLPIIAEVTTGMRKYVSVYGTNYDTPDGSCIRDYIHVADLATAHTKALNYLENNHLSQVFNLGTSSGVSVLEMIEAFKQVSGQNIQTKFEDKRKGDPPKSYASFEKANQILQWAPKFSDKITIVKTMIQTYQKHCHL